MNIEKNEYKCSLDISKIREEFEGLSQKVNSKPLVYFDNAATTMRLKSVVNTLINFYKFYNSNIHRAVHTLAEIATEQYENVRKEVASFIGCEPEEVFFVRGTTEGMNVIANGLPLKNGDTILITEMEHHANIVPWQMLRNKKGIKIEVVPILQDGTINYDKLHEIITKDKRIKVISFAHISNVLGIINDVKKVVDIARQNGCIVIVDGAQAVSHIKVNVKDLGCDFYVFSGHKIFGPFGVGVVFGRKELLNDLEPYLGGGSMIEEVSFEKTTYLHPPYKFEGGTPPIADVIALAPAITFLKKNLNTHFTDYEKKLADYLFNSLSLLDFVEIVGSSTERIPLVSFNIRGVHHYDVGVLLNNFGIAVRTGHHCAQPLHRKFNLSGTVRTSLTIYNTIEEIDYLIECLKKIRDVFT